MGNTVCCILMKGFRFYLRMCCAYVCMQKAEEDIWSVILPYIPLK